MSMTITLTEDLAGRLRVQAQTQQLSVEQWALTILGTRPSTRMSCEVGPTLTADVLT